MPHPRRFVAFAVVLLTAAAARSQPAVVGRVDSADGSFLRRAATQAAFEPLTRGATTNADDRLVALPGATLMSANSGVVLTSRADYDGSSPFPILETAVVIHKSDRADLELTLDRGRIDLTNAKPLGAATVRLRFHRNQWVITLDAPGARVAVEVISRWPAGSAFYKTPVEGHEPVVAAVLIVLSGSASVADGKTTLALTAPPGPALVEWTSTGVARLAAKRLDKLPEWANSTVEDRPNIREARDAVEAFRAKLASDTLGEAVDAFLASSKPAERRVGLVLAGATDDLTRLANGLAATRDRETWDFGVSVLRHWVGRGPGQDRAFYKYLTDDQKWTSARAEIVLDLLHGFADDEQSKPETYEVLIGYLQSENSSIRNLAAWHLHRLVPTNKSIVFQPNASKAEFEPVYKSWKALIPPGQLPPAAAPVPKAGK